MKARAHFFSEAQHEPGTVGGSWADSQPRAVAGRSSSGHEGRIVEEICNPTGVKMTPSRTQLSQFVQAVRECESPDYVCYLLCENLADNNWKKRLVSNITKLAATILLPNLESSSCNPRAFNQQRGTL